jgi:hypothetical protein
MHVLYVNMCNYKIAQMYSVFGDALTELQDHVLQTTWSKNV